MKEIYKKIQMCRQSIKETSTPKLGHNDYSDYDYFTPEQIHALAFNACKDQGLFYKFDLNKDEFGLFGKLEIIDLETFESVDFIMRTDIPVIKATNITQQIGGAVTYTQRYLLMNVFDIQDNNLDPDTTENTKKTNQEQKNNTIDAKKDVIAIKKELTQKEVEKWNGKIYKDNIVYIDNIKRQIPSEQIEKLKQLENYKPYTK